MPAPREHAARTGAGTAPADTGAPARPFRWRHLVLLSAAVMLTVSLETLPAGILPKMGAEFSRSDSAIGMLVSAWGFTVILTSLPLVRLVAQWDRRSVTAACLGVTGVFSLGTALAPGYSWALVSRVLGGASHGVFWALVVVYAAALVPPRFLATGIALVTGGSQLAAAVVIPAAASLVQHVHWRWIYGALAVLAAGIALAVRLLLPADRPRAPTPGTRRSGPLWRDQRARGPLALAVVALLFVFAHFVVYTYATVYFVDASGAPDPRIGIFLAIIGAASILGLVISGPLANRWPRYGLVVYLGLFAAAMVLIVPAALPVRVTGLALWGLMFGTIGPICQAIALRFSPEEFRPAISAAMVVTFNLGISMGSFVGGLAVDTASGQNLPTQLGQAHLTGAPINPVLAAVALLLAAALAWWAGSRLREHPAPRP